VKLNILFQVFRTGNAFPVVGRAVSVYAAFPLLFTFVVNSVFCGRLARGEAYSPKAFCSLLSVSCLSVLKGSTFSETLAKLGKFNENRADKGTFLRITMKKSGASLAKFLPLPKPCHSRRDFVHKWCFCRDTLLCPLHHPDAHLVEQVQGQQHQRQCQHILPQKCKSLAAPQNNAIFSCRWALHPA